MHALLLAICMWSLYAVDLATPGLRDRGGDVKSADFLHFYTAGWLIHSGRAQAIYDPPALAGWQERLVPGSAGVYFVASYGPQVYLPFSLLARLPYGWAAIIWALLNCLLYFACCYSVWRTCPHLQPYAGAVFLLAVACPGFFNLIAFGQTSGPALALFTVAFLALRSRRNLLAGLAIGSLVYKPQLALAAAIVFFSTAEWKIVASAIAAAAAQLSLAWKWFGGDVMHRYWHSLLRSGGALPFIEPKLYEMHSLRGFWLLLLPGRSLATELYVITAAVVLGLAVFCWRSRAPLGLRYAALLLATVLAAPHLMIYDLVILAPAFLLLGEWVLDRSESRTTPGVRIFLYLTYALPLLEPLAQLTRVQFSVIAFAVLLVLTWSAIKEDALSAPSSLATSAP